MSPGDVENEADRLFQEAGLSSSGPVCVGSLIRRLVGDCALRFAPDHALPGNGALVRVGSEWRIYLRRGAPDHLKRFVALHELAHWALGPEASEDDCDRLAGALLLPRQAFLEGILARRRMVALARAFGSDETCAWLRYGELTETPVALVAPRRVRLRGPAYSWPAEPTIRALAKRTRIPGIKKAILRDDRERAVLRAV